MVKTIKNPLVSLGVLKVPGTPRSGKTPNFSIFTFKCGKVVFSTPFPEMPLFWIFSIFGVPATFKTPSETNGSLMVLTMGAERAPFS